MLVALVLVAAACSGERGPSTRSSTSARDEVMECGAAGSITDLSREPSYASKDLQRWTTEDGCPVRLDVLMTRTGPAHCGWQAATDILMGVPLGASHSHGPHRIYVRDPQGVLNDPAITSAFDGDARLSDRAEDTGFRQHDAQLWLIRGAPEQLFLVFPDRVERWPLDTSPAGCA